MNPGSKDSTSQQQAKLTGKYFIVCVRDVLLTLSVWCVGRQMFERDASLALSDARFLTEGNGH